MSDTVGSALERALETLDALESLGTDVEDEWTYVTELAEAWRVRLSETADRRAGEPLTGAVAAAIDRVAAEAESITDPHRAIDWLSTFPQVVLVALGERS